MGRRLLPALLLCFACLPVSAQDKPKDEELNFVQQLRARGLPDLALEYLEKRIDKAKYGVVLNLEIAQTRLELAAAEADAEKRVALFAQARQEFEKFANENPTHERATDAKLQIAQVGALQGRTQMARALAIPSGDDTRKDELTKANQLLAAAGQGLEAITDQLKTDELKNQATFARALLLTNQGRLFLALGDDVKTGELGKQAALILEPLGEKLENRDPMRAMTLAWAGRAWSLAGDASKAKLKWAEALGTNTAIARRLVPYFQMLAIDEDDRGVTPEKRALLIKTGIDWLAAFAGARNTPEGFGVQYMLAKHNFEAGLILKTPQQRKPYFDQADFYVKRLEAVENEYSALAQQIKIDILFQEGKFSAPEATILNTGDFNDNYMRALYEHQQLSKNEKGKFDDLKAREQQQRRTLKFLEAALEKSKKEKPTAVDMGNVYFLLTGYYATLKDLLKTKEIGLQFVEKYPRSRHAKDCALFVADALQQRVQTALKEDPNGNPPERDELIKLAKIMVNRWPADKAGEYGRFLISDLSIKNSIGITDPVQRLNAENVAVTEAGDVARFQLGLQRAKEKNFLRCIELLGPIQPTNSRYALSQYQIALACLQLQQENDQIRKNNAERKKKDPMAKEEPLRRLAADNREFRDIAVAALERIPDPANTDADTVAYFVKAKVELGFMLYPVKKYDQMNQLSTKLAPFVAMLKNEEEKKLFQTRVNTIRMYAIYGKADDAYRANKYAEVLQAVDPLLKELREGKYPELKENQPLQTSLYGLALRSNLLAGNIKPAQDLFVEWSKAERDRLGLQIAKDRATLEESLKGLPKKLAEIEQNKDLTDVQKKEQIDGLKQTQATLNKNLDDLKQAESRVNEGVTKHNSSVVEQVAAVVKKLMQDEIKAGRKPQADTFKQHLGGFLVAIRADATLAFDPLSMTRAFLVVQRYGPAAQELSKFPAPVANAPQAEVDKWRQAQVLRLRTLRLHAKETSDEKATLEASKLLDSIMAPTDEDKKNNRAGWGKRDLNALKEEIELLLDRKFWGAAVNRAQTLLNMLSPKLRESQAIKDHYFEGAHLYILALTNYAISLKEKDEAKMDLMLTRSANFYAKLKTNFPDLGGEESKARFDSFLLTPEGKQMAEKLPKPTDGAMK